jgi:hypothetical protein
MRACACVLSGSTRASCASSEDTVVLVGAHTCGVTVQRMQDGAAVRQAASRAARPGRRRLVRASAHFARVADLETVEVVPARRRARRRRSRARWTS